MKGLTFDGCNRLIIDFRCSIAFGKKKLKQTGKRDDRLCLKRLNMILIPFIVGGNINIAALSYKREYVGCYF